jgi:FAD/FMN-containing dehydrogenase
MKKDNTGYDLKHLFIGSEGTLGLVTKVAIQCPVKPKSVQLALFGINEFTNVLQTFKQAKQNLGEILSACEYMDKSAVESVTRNLNVRNPIGDFPFYMIIEASGSNEKHDEEKLNGFLEKIMADGVVQDGTVASDYTQIRSIWELRERIIEAQLLDGFVYLSDFSVPINGFHQFVQDVQKQVGDLGAVSGFGHLGDSNIHLHVIAKEYTPELLSKIEPFVYEWTSKQRGSVSAEHGLGFKKKDYLPYSKSGPVIEMMRNVKNVFDPNNILNPYKVLPDKI